MVALAVALGAVIGLVVGSFLNVVAYRVPAGISIVTPPSACPNCKSLIRHRDNVPVLGWLMLRGRCRDCSEPISPRYPIVEAVTGVLFALVPAIIGVLWVVPAYWAFVAVTIALTLTDLDLKKIPNKILYPGTIIAGSLLIVGSLLDGDPGRLLPAAGSAAGYFGALFLLALLARGGFGFGDVKLAFLLGLFVGYISWQYVMVAAFAAFGAAGLYAIVVLALRRRGRKSEIPFGPYLIVGSYLAIAFGDPAITWWLR